MTQARRTGHPSIASMSFGGSSSRPLDDATRSVGPVDCSSHHSGTDHTLVSQLINSGVHSIVAAGNSNVDAASTSPAHVVEAITVGASDITDARALYSNFGSVVDVFAPGSGVISTWNDGGIHTLSGTSMATPHVSGLVAYFIALFGNLSPAATADRIRTYALQGVLSGVRESYVFSFYTRDYRLTLLHYFSFWNDELLGEQWILSRSDRGDETPKAYSKYQDTLGLRNYWHVIVYTICKVRELEMYTC
jgi:subtilisin family serine protease